MELDPQQKLAVKTDSRRALVIAGAGSGKTRVLVERIAHLVEKCHASPYEIMAWSFTRKASNELKTRLVDRLGPSANRVTCGTMHGVALSTIHRYHEILGLKKDTTVYSEWEESFLLRGVATEMGVLKKKTWKPGKKLVDACFAAYYERGEEPAQNDSCRPLFHAFFQRCRENNALTYGNLLIGLEALIPTMAKHGNIRHIWVDECQDLDPLQWRIINGMCEAFGASLFAVGDADQSIYKFRGATPEYIIDHQSEFDTYLLEANYRSARSIVDGANRLIAHNQARIGKTMHATMPEMNHIIRLSDMDSEGLSWTIKGITDTGEKPGDFAVLARTHVLLRRLSEELTERGIDHEYVGSKSASTNTEEFRRFHAFLKLIVNPYDNFSFLLIKDLIGLTNVQFAEIRYEAAKQGASHFQIWLEWADGRDDPYERFFASSTFSFAADVFALQYAATGCAGWNPDGWGFDITDVLSFIWGWLAEHHGSLQEYLDWLSIFDVQDEITDEPQGLTLCTIHAAKGLEWPVVILAGVNQGIIPSKHAIAAGEIEEERRLMYVAATRARDQLIITTRPECTEKDGRIYESPISQFVSEMGQ